MSQEKLEKELSELQELAKHDKNIDIASLMLNALHKHEANLLTPKEKRWAYLLSLGLPPVGLIFALKFVFSDKDDARQAALFCLALTIASVLLTILLFKVMLSGSGTSIEQIQQINPQSIQELLE